ncbi:MAG: ATP-grasp domain-containing protein [Bacteroidia bacterium]|nr:ATP-grasp domain-containing protein [Bacteroidia bacterium]
MKESTSGLANLNLINVENAIWVIQSWQSIPAYDFDFRSWFQCRGANSGDENIQAFGRLGAIRDYRKLSQDLNENGVFLINSPEQSERAGFLSKWYPHLQDLTPKSVCYTHFPSREEIERDFSWPVFIKGDRQTSRHNQKLSVARNFHEFEYIKSAYQSDKILNWQSVVCREFVNLRKVADSADGKVQRSFEFRLFFWKGNLVSAGPYWQDEKPYFWTKDEELEAVKIATLAAERLNVPFLVVDLAMKENGEWIIIECNDGQESGYAGNSPIRLWQAIIDHEKKNFCTIFR